MTWDEIKTWIKEHPLYVGIAIGVVASCLAGWAL